MKHSVEDNHLVIDNVSLPLIIMKPYPDHRFISGDLKDTFEYYPQFVKFSNDENSKKWSIQVYLQMVCKAAANYVGNGHENKPKRMLDHYSQYDFASFSNLLKKYTKPRVK